MTSPEEDNDQTINMKLAQMRNILKHKKTTADYVLHLLRTGYDINCSISSTHHLKLKKPELIGCTALHLAFMENHIEGFKVLINGTENGAGADYTIKNKDGLTVLHQVLQNCYKSESMHRLESEYARLILSNHLENKNHKNPCTKYGLSHFHAACLCNNAELVKMFLQNRVSSNECVEKDAPFFPGYSPLHFAVRSYAFESVKVLLENGANQHLENAERKTPLHMLIEQKIRLLNSTSFITIVPSGSLENILEDHERILHLLYQHNNDDWVKFSAFHLACIMKDSSVLETMLKNGVNINLAVDQNSPLWPGFTGLHFAALCNFDNLMLLLNNGANIEVANAAGVTAFDLCLSKYKVEQIHKILSSVNMWKEIVLSDGETTLLELVNAMQSSDQLQTFLNTSDARVKVFIPFASVLWPGFTVLHVAVQLFISHLEIVNTCLNAGADVKVKCANGLSAVHLAFRQEKMYVVGVLLKHCTDILNLTDNENLSVLHIACATSGDNDLVKNLLQSRVNVNVAYRGKPIGAYLRTGFTPLHVAVVSGNDEMIRELLNCGANRYATDSGGFTPIHWVLGAPNPDKVGAELLLSESQIREFAVSGLSHLHVVSYVKERQRVDNQCFDNSKMVVELLRVAQPNTNIAVEYNENSSSPPFTSKIAGMTPLFLAVQNRNWQTARVLLANGADIFAKPPDWSISFYDALNALNRYGALVFFSCLLMGNGEARLRVKEETGLTMLHLACYSLYGDVYKFALENGETNMDAQIHMDSPIWPGYTPLHLLVNSNADGSVTEKFKYYRFNTNLKNADGETAIHLAYKNINEKEKISRRCWLYYLLDKHLNYSTNPVDNDGLSHFHIACAAIRYKGVEQFLLNKEVNGVNVNTSVDAFSEMNGESPLHLALSSEQLVDMDDERYEVALWSTVNLLLRAKALVNAQNARGDTAVHKIFMHGITHFALFQEIVKADADLKAINIFGATPLELLFYEYVSYSFSSDHLWAFIERERDCRINAFNPLDKRGYISLIFERSCDLEFEEKAIIFNAMLRYRRTADTDEEGRTVIHNIVANSVSQITQYYGLIDQLVTITRCSCDVDDQDKHGKTALHYAASFGNDGAFNSLLFTGADINITDNRGRSAFHYFNQHTNVSKDFAAKHVKRLELLRCHVSEENRQIADDVFRRYELDIVSLRNELTKDLQRAEKVETGFLSVSLRNFLCEPSTKTMRALNANPTLFEKFFRDFDHSIVPELCSVYKFLYRKALTRDKLMYQALDALSRLSGCSHLCAEFILEFVTNADLENVMKARKLIFDD